MILKDFEKIRIETVRLILRPYKSSDYDNWVSGFINRKKKQHKYDAGPHDPAETPRKWFINLIKKYRKLAKEDQVYIFGIFLKSTGQNIGHIDYATIQRRNRNWANLGYLMHNNYQNQGYATEILKASVPMAFCVLKYKRVEAAINIDNIRSIRLAKSIGMKKECLRKQFMFENEKWTDQVIFVIQSKNKKITT